MNYIQRFVNKILCTSSKKENKLSLDKFSIDLEVEKDKGEIASISEKKLGKDSMVVEKKSVNKTIETKSNKINLNKNLQKELIYYLSNDVSLDNSLLKMNKEKKTEELSSSKVIKFTKKDSYKNLKRILIQFITGIFLIIFTLSYIKTQPAEEKFLNSSVQLWINTFQNLISKFGGVYTQQVDNNYIKKRTEMINQLIDDETKVKLCLDKTTDEVKIKELQQLLSKIQTFKKFLSDTNVLSLDNFIRSYDQYSLYVYSLNKSVLQVCK